MQAGNTSPRIQTPKNSNMGKTKNKKADKPIYSGGILWDGNLIVKTIRGEHKTIRTDLGGMALQRADPNKELIILLHQHAGYNELDTGYIVRSRQYDVARQPYFGLKSTPDSDVWGCYKYAEVIAWGYADGGLNDPTLFYSCQSTVEEEMVRERHRAEKGIKTHAERLAEMEAEAEEEEMQRGLILRYRHKDGKIESETSWPLNHELPEKLQKFMKPTLANFLSFTKDNPDIPEVHYFTELTPWEADFEENQDDET